MPQQVFYRKWRPQTFEEVVGQNHVTTTLLNALKLDRVAHAYLLSGPRGTGKTTTGRILAKAVNCRNSNQGEPCNKCSACQSVINGNAVDLIEIDAASNRGIDEIRSLREKVNFSPTECKYKIYLMDEVHMLTTPAFNALLKTLEEPPPHTLFILATTEPHKLPATVVSRCQRFDLRRISKNDVVDRLSQICESEQIEFTPKALLQIARSAEGSLRDAENLLEQLVAGQDGGVNEEAVRGLLGIVQDNRVADLVTTVLSGNIPDGLSIINQVSSEGSDLRQFQRSLCEYLRILMLVKAGLTEPVDKSEDELNELKVSVENISSKTIIHALKSFSTADLRTSLSSTLPLELALVESISANQKESDSQRPTRALIKPSSPSPSSLPNTSSTQDKSTVVPEATSESAKKPEEAPVKTNLVQPDRKTTSFTKNTGSQFNLLRDNWKAVVQASRGKGQKYKLDALLRGAQIISFEEDIIMLGFTHQSFVDMMEQELENPASRLALEEAIGNVLGERHQVRCSLRPLEAKSEGGHLMKAAVDELGAKMIGGDNETT